MGNKFKIGRIHFYILYYWQKCIKICEENHNIVDILCTGSLLPRPEPLKKSFLHPPSSFRGPVNSSATISSRSLLSSVDHVLRTGQTKTLKLSEKQYFSSVNKTHSKPCVHCDWEEEALGTPFFVPSSMTDEMLDLRLKATIDCCGGLCLKGTPLSVKKNKIVLEFIPGPVQKKSPSLLIIIT